MSSKVGNTALSFARVWHHVDVAEDPRTLGRLASQIAITLMGKHKPIYHATQDTGDYVVVSNCSHLKYTGNKLTEKTYWKHTGRPGSGKAVPMAKIAADQGFGEVLKKAVSRMLPKNKLRTPRLERLKVFDGSDHPYKQNIIAFADQKPQVDEKLAKLDHNTKILKEFNARNDKKA
ncbi:hypothetical protein PACTADRAFT_3936 [Pachysolen tannophilus NRRL Y-2460]|uniref:Large ribosomal subunit protein uL13m n=1 Tax=Pachysolen tannophilus NRRL Y-2460 TaxID=669874 RepID=A0A1E4TTK6_PACTA|nr:hypothetical protein PACTADRAFT_3936 [Pachysolen tannophilus NRRL Y-2460]